MLDVIFLAAAEDDLAQGYNFYESTEFGLGDRSLNCVQGGLSLIGQHPEIFPICASEVS
jgi:hypothetical protein